MDTLRGLRDGEVRSPIPESEESDLLHLYKPRAFIPSIEAEWSSTHLLEEGGAPNINSVYTRSEGPQDSARRLAEFAAYKHYGVGEHGPSSRLQAEEIGHYASESRIDVRAIISQTWGSMTGVLSAEAVGPGVKREIVRQRYLGKNMPTVELGRNYAQFDKNPTMRGLSHLLEGDITRYKFERAFKRQPSGALGSVMRSNRTVLYDDIFKRFGVSKSRFERAYTMGGPQLDRFTKGLSKRGVNPREVEGLVSGALHGKKLPKFEDYLLMTKKERAQMVKSLPVLSSVSGEEMATQKALGLPQTRLSHTGANPTLSGARPIKMLEEMPSQLSTDQTVRPAQAKPNIEYIDSPRPQPRISSKVSLNIHDGGYDKKAVMNHTRKVLR